MAKVNVKYFGLFRQLTKTDREEMSAESLEELIKKIISKYKCIEEYFHEKTGSDPSLILTYNGNIVSGKDYEIKLKDGDEILVLSLISGG
jgi:MoaD family protein